MTTMTNTPDALIGERLDRAVGTLLQLAQRELGDCIALLHDVDAPHDAPADAALVAELHTLAAVTETIALAAQTHRRIAEALA